MERRQASFLALVAAQTAHSIEESVGRLYDVFPPAVFLSGLVSEDRRLAFIALNLALIAFGVLCFLGPVRRQWSSAVAVGWLWVGLELVNGSVHLLWSIYRRGYTPGVATAPLLLVFALLLARELRAVTRQGP